MKTVVNTKQFNKALERVAYELYGYQMTVRITTLGDNQLKIEASAPYQYSAEIISADIIEPGSVILDTIELKKLLKSLEAENLQIIAEFGKCFINDLKLNTYHIQQYSQAENLADAEVVKITINGEDFKEALNRTVFILNKDKDKTGYAFDNLGLIFKKDGILDIVGTTSYRLAKYSINYTGEYNNTVLIRRSTAEQLKKILPNNDIEILIISKIKHNKKRVYLQIIDAGYMLEIAILTNEDYKYKFPNYEVVILKDVNFTAEIETKPFLKALNKLLKTAKEDPNNKVIFTFSDGKLSLTAKGTTAEVPAEFEHNFEIAFNCKYLIDFLKSIKSEKFTFEAHDKDTQTNFKTNEPNYIYLLAPVNL